MTKGDQIHLVEADEDLLWADGPECALCGAPLTAAEQRAGAGEPGEPWCAACAADEALEQRGPKCEAAS